jgi:hypothetical protein
MKQLAYTFRLLTCLFFLSFSTSSCHVSGQFHSRQSLKAIKSLLLFKPFVTIGTPKNGISVHNAPLSAPIPQFIWRAFNEGLPQQIQQTRAVVDSLTQQQLDNDLFSLIRQVGDKGKIRGIALPASVLKVMDQNEADFALSIQYMGTVTDATGYGIMTCLVLDRQARNIARYTVRFQKTHNPTTDSLVNAEVKQLLAKSFY